MNKVVLLLLVLVAVASASNHTNGTNVTITNVTIPVVTPAPTPPVGYNGQCQEQCCCKVCSSPSNEAFPYGLTDVDIQINPPNPKVRGSTCGFPVWSDREYNDTNDNLVTAPDTLWWTNFGVFADSTVHTAPFTCSCCQFSGIDTSCSEQRPAARRPQHFYVQGGYAVEYQPLTLIFEDGVELSQTDIVELRNDTHCGYSPPHAARRATNNTVRTGTKGVEASEVQWDIAKLPTDGCYRVCYYHSTLTTPTWYTIGFVTVHNQPQADVTHKINPRDVTLSENQVTITFLGESLLSVFDDAAELRSSGACGAASPATSTTLTTNGILNVPGEWCKPKVEQPISAIRPLRRLAVLYSDCPVKNRIYQNEVIWDLKLPNVGGDTTFTVCYRLGATWKTLQTFTVFAQQAPETALQTFYTATNGPNWLGQREWGGSDACLYHGIRCTLGKVSAIHLGRNNLDGTIPDQLFLADYYLTLEHIALDMNSLTGTLPHTIGALRNLKFLDLGFNQMSGSLPVSLQRTSLFILYVSNNQFEGAVPESLAELQQLWEKISDIVDFVAIPPPPGCPYDVLECSEKGSTDNGVFSCGHEGISELECTVRGCCFNAQAPLVFGGTACFTKRSAFVQTHPSCTADTCQVQQATVQ